MFILVGTFPQEDFGLLAGKVLFDNFELKIENKIIPITRGTPALAGAVCVCCEVLNLEFPFLVLGGDIGKGNGSQKVYNYLINNLGSLKPTLIVFHYLLPNIDWEIKMLLAIEELSCQPKLIADAGHMYAAKMSGQASKYDLFTPDIGELAFLADECAPHPFYTRGFILHQEENTEELIRRSVQHKNAAKYLLVKGAKDYIVKKGEILKAVDSPCEPALEAIGGTGDTLTGIVSALVRAGFSWEESLFLGAKVNRLAGSLAKPTPATQIIDIIKKIPEALRTVLSGNKRYS
ncbi:NAD(P)H-hydrate repair enzyme Nnr, NAD(P)H-hydrate dehydratase domain [Desulfonauticus submarinus]|uniref:NAD(P)H-hydrate repair enzyme Nnr, NAD(P)H-hydrate dehydratase domain n=1 Tax=Desulfonauticus submarinus TaxID=206665 RepID=A0A1H0BCX5_9BACT|nr:NAD(P)H-hydrate dehydratase [Desulfonauticus submarinus]SDN43489.1 NAD(P)H-hydrate repair enzyme Nnr, NAD(P)H-hydrate dehydratase domain [Desulfonauticus submarinus]